MTESRLLRSWIEFLEEVLKWEMVNDHPISVRIGVKAQEEPEGDQKWRRRGSNEMNLKMRVVCQPPSSYQPSSTFRANESWRGPPPVPVFSKYLGGSSGWRILPPEMNDQWLVEGFLRPRLEAELRSRQLPLDGFDRVCRDLVVVLPPNHESHLLKWLPRPLIEQLQRKTMVFFPWSHVIDQGLRHHLCWTTRRGKSIYQSLAHCLAGELDIEEQLLERSMQSDWSSESSFTNWMMLGHVLSKSEEEEHIDFFGEPIPS